MKGFIDYKEDVIDVKEPFIFLSPDVTRDNALILINWLQDDDVRRFLSDPQDVSRNIEQLINRVQPEILTQFFNKGGRFFMVYNKQSKPIGFVRLVKKPAETEIVVVIGDKDNWGKRFGTATIRESLKKAFFEFRSEKVTANIHQGNKRSINIFVRAGFVLQRETQSLKHFEITLEQYMKSIQEKTGTVDMIYITEIDRDRIKSLLTNVLFDESITEKSVANLEQEIERATIVKPEQLPRDIITMNSKALICLNGDDIEVSLVYPGDADWSEHKISIFSPVGTAILGYAEGDTIQWDVPSGTTEIQIRKVLYQPESAGDYHL